MIVSSRHPFIQPVAPNPAECGKRQIIQKHSQYTPKGLLDNWMFGLLDSLIFVAQIASVATLLRNDK